MTMLDTSPTSITRSISDIPSYYSSVFQEMATNLLSLRPSQITNQDLLNLECILNEAYLKANQYEWSVDLQNALLNGLAQATELSEIAQRNPGQPRSKYFYQNIKKLVSFLQVVAVFVLDESSGTA